MSVVKLFYEATEFFNNRQNVERDQILIDTIARNLKFECDERSIKPIDTIPHGIFYSCVFLSWLGLGNRDGIVVDCE